MSDIPILNLDTAPLGEIVTKKSTKEAIILLSCIAVGIFSVGVMIGSLVTILI